MTHRLKQLGTAIGIALFAQASGAAPILTPVQSVSFCLGVCDVQIVPTGQLRQTGNGTLFNTFSNTTGDPVSLTKTDSTTRVFNGFDNSLGILKKVTFTLTSSIRIGLDGGFEDPSDSTLVTTSMTVDPSIALVSLGTMLTDPALSDFALSGAYFSSPVVDTATRNATVSKTPPDDLSFFTSGGTFVTLFAQNLALKTVSDCVSTTGNARWEGTLDLQYEYETRPTESVPEPGTLLLVGAGMLGAAARLRRKAVAEGV